MMRGSWGRGRPVARSTFDPLLHDQDTPIDVLLRDPEYSGALRTANLRFVNAMTTEKRLADLIQWVLTDVHCGEAGAKGVITQAVSTLSAQVRPLQRALYASDMLLASLNDFVDTPGSRKPGVCYNYQRVVESLLRFKGAEFVARVPRLRDFLIARVGLMGVRELFLSICCEFHDAFVADAAFMTEVAAQLLNYEIVGQLNIVAALMGVVRIRPESLGVLMVEGVVRELLKAAQATQDTLVGAKVLELVEVINNGAPAEVRALLGEYPLEMSRHGSAQARYLRLSGAVGGLVESVFDDPTNFEFNRAVVDVLRGMEAGPLREALVAADVVAKLSAKLAAEEHLTGQQLSLVELALQSGELTETQQLADLMDAFNLHDVPLPPPDSRFDDGEYVMQARDAGNRSEEEDDDRDDGGDMSDSDDDNLWDMDDSDGDDMAVHASLDETDRFVPDVEVPSAAREGGTLPKSDSLDFEDSDEETRGKRENSAEEVQGDSRDEVQVTGLEVIENVSSLPYSCPEGVLGMPLPDELAAVEAEEAVADVEPLGF